MCNKLFVANEDIILKNRKSMLPYSSFKKNLEDMINNEERAVHIFDTIDGNAEQENLDDALEMEPIDDLELPQEQDEQQIGAVSGGSESFKFKPITFGDEDEMRADVKSLSYEQRMAFDFVIQLCKKKVVQRSNPSFVVKPEPLIVTGK